MSYERDGLLAKAGIDVSFLPGEIDWQAVAAAAWTSPSFVYRGYTEGGAVPGFLLRPTSRGALEAGLEVGVYFFSQAITPQEGWRRPSSC